MLKEISRKGAKTQRTAKPPARGSALRLCAFAGESFLALPLRFDTHRFWYRKLSRGANLYMIFDADTMQKKPAFDHEKIAAALSTLTNNIFNSNDLSLSQLRFDNNIVTFSTNIDGVAVRCTIADAVCTKIEAPARPQGPVKSRDGKWEALIFNYNLAIRSTDGRGNPQHGRATGAVKNQITRGEWVVRAVQRVDESKRQIWFSAGGTHAGKDPYFASYFRINFDGSGLTELTTADANHNVVYSTDAQLYVDNYSRLNLPNVLEVRKTADNSVVATVEGTRWEDRHLGRDHSAKQLRSVKEVSGDRKHLRRARRVRLCRSRFLLTRAWMAQAEIGFIVVQIDGMGTANRSKAFHDVAWKNRGDAGFPDRILWHKAVAAKYPWYDISRVGIYGGSAGGQNSLGGLLFHPEFYKAAASYAGCHDNRMDKIWWNEQWMGWPIGPQYSASSNVDNAYRLRGDLLLVVGEMDTNVDPSLTMQVVHQLLKHNKNFDLLVVPGANHGAARGDRYAAYGDHKRYDFFVRHLLGTNPPPWNQVAESTSQSSR